MAGKRLHTDDQVTAMVAAYEQGTNVSTLRRLFGGSADAVLRALERGGAVIRRVQRESLSASDIATMKTMLANGARQVDVALSLGRPPTTINTTFRRLGLSQVPRIGEKSNGWKGGEFLHKSSGYVMAWTPDGSVAASMRNPLGYVLKHRKIMAEHLGRSLLKTETVHHVDGNTLNNEIGNLQLRQGRHGKHVVLRCRACGSEDLEHKPL